MYNPESLEYLRQRIDLVDVLSAHVKLVRSGASYKACCPFHEEKSPSFVVQRGETHYHCYGCGAHGDAIAFMMSYLKMSFVDAVESLAERFQVRLEKMDATEERKGPSKSLLKHALEKACKFYHFTLLHTEEGHRALKYLYERGIDLEFIKAFQIGYAPKEGDLLYRFLSQDTSEEILLQAGLLNSRKRDFFAERITFPICDAAGAVIGFSARKFKEETFGGKYINTPETPLFKKSKTLYGLSYSRQRIAKERKAIIVEGQIDALRLIHSGFNITVAGQGTAFGEEHVTELLNLGVNQVYLALDGDKAGQEAAVKIGHLFQKKGVEVLVLALPEGLDPDGLLRSQGSAAFTKLMEEGIPYLDFLYRHLAKELDVRSPSKKNELIQTIATRIRAWDQPVMVHESLRKLAQIAGLPEEMIGVQQLVASHTFVKKSSPINFDKINPNRILEADVLRWLVLMGQTMPRILEIAGLNVKPTFFRDPTCRKLYEIYSNEPSDLLALSGQFQEGDEQQLLAEIMQKKVNLQRAEEGFIECIRKLQSREWMDEREAVKNKIQSGTCSEEEVLELAKQFDTIRKNKPEVILP